MPTATVTLHLPGRRIPATLTTSHATASHGQPVLVVKGGKSFEGREVAHGPGDVTSYGPACCLLLTTEDEREDEQAEALLERWDALCAPLRDEHDLTMATEWLDAGGWLDGSTWTRETDEGDRHLLDELDAAPLERQVVKHVVDDPDVDDAYGASWTFPDGSGVVEVGMAWDTFGPDGRTEYGRIVRPGEENPDVNPTLDARYVAVWDAPARGEPDPLPPEVREAVDRLLRRRNTCPEDEVDAIDRELRALLDPYVEAEP